MSFLVPTTKVNHRSTLAVILQLIEVDLEQWYRQMRIAVKDKTFAMFPAAAQEYYEKRRDYLKEVEEYQLRGLITAAIPVGINGWCDSVLPPTIIMKNSTIPSQTEELNLINPFEMISSDTSNTISTSSSFTTSDGSCDINSDLESSSPPSSFSSVHSGDVALQQVQIPISVVDTPLLLDTLPRNPPIAFTPRPPPESMSPKAKLECLYRWTLFSPDGHIFLAKEPRDKKFIMNWSDAEVEAADLVKWAQEMWWPIWKRQFRTNYVGMWKKRMEKEDKTAESKKLEADKKAAVQREADDKKEKLMSRLAAINKGTEGLIDRDAPKPILFGNTSVKAEV
jgi:hypothetical protein